MRSCAELPVAARLDLAGDEIAPHGIEWRCPATPADLVTFPQRLEPLVVTDGMAVVLGHVTAQIDAQAGQVEAVGPAVVIDRAVADRAAR